MPPGRPGKSPRRCPRVLLLTPQTRLGTVAACGCGGRRSPGSLRRSHWTARGVSSKPDAYGFSLISVDRSRLEPLGRGPGCTYLLDEIQWVDAAESAYLSIGCPFFTWSARKRLVRNRKFYPIDTGLRRVSVTATGQDRGKQLECAIFLLLRRRFRSVQYWRGVGEVDFVDDAGRGPVPVQVSWARISDGSRRAVDEFHAAHPTAGEPVFVTAESFEADVPDLPSGQRAISPGTWRSSMRRCRSRVCSMKSAFRTSSMRGKSTMMRPS